MQSIFYLVTAIIASVEYGKRNFSKEFLKLFFPRQIFSIFWAGSIIQTYLRLFLLIELYLTKLMFFSQKSKQNNSLSLKYQINLLQYF